MPPAMPNCLIVTRPFQGYEAGDHIRDTAAIAKAWHSSNHAKVVAVSGAHSPKAPPSESEVLPTAVAG